MRHHRARRLPMVLHSRWVSQSVRSQSVPGQYTEGGSVTLGNTLPHPHDSWISGGGKKESVLGLRPSVSTIRTLDGAVSRQLLIENSRVHFQGSIYWICGYSGNDIIFLRIPVPQFSPVIIIPPCSFKYHPTINVFFYQLMHNWIVLKTSWNLQ